MLGILLQVLIGPVGLRIIYADADRKSAITIAAFAVIANPLGIWLLKQTTPDIARLLIAAIAIGAFLLVLLPQKPGIRPGPKKLQRRALHPAFSPALPRCPARR